MSLAFAVVYEAAADFRTATDLADRILVEAIVWLEPEHLQHQRTWLGDHLGDALTWKRLKKIALDRGIVALGHFDGRPGEADAKAARRALQVLRDLFPKLEGVMLVRDQDDQTERREGLDQARNAEVAFPVVVRLAVVERESWLICGFDPRDEPEESRLTEERQTLGFDPRLVSHKLTACKDDQAKRSPKRVLLKLGGGDQDRETHCWRETSLEVLKERGAENGLALFLTEIRGKFPPLIGHVTEP